MNVQTAENSKWHKSNENQKLLLLSSIYPALMGLRTVGAPILCEVITHMHPSRTRWLYTRTRKTYFRMLTCTPVFVCLSYVAVTDDGLRPRDSWLHTCLRIQRRYPALLRVWRVRLLQKWPDQATNVLRQRYWRLLFSGELTVLVIT